MINLNPHIFTFHIALLHNEIYIYMCFLCKIYAHQLNQTVKRRNEFLNGHKLLLLVFVFYIVWIILVSWCSIKCYWTLQIADKNITGLFILHFFCTLRFVAFSNYLITNVLKSIYNQMKQSMCSMAVIHYLRMKTFFSNPCSVPMVSWQIVDIDSIYDWKVICYLNNMVYLECQILFDDLGNCFRWVYGVTEIYIVCFLREFVLLVYDFIILAVKDEIAKSHEISFW